MRILIWGTGKLAKRYMKFDFFVGHDIVGFVDSYKRDQVFLDYPVYDPHEVTELDYDYLIICVLKENLEIIKNCIAKRINLNKVIILTEKEELSKVVAKELEMIQGIEDVRDIFPVVYRDRENAYKQKEHYKNIISTNLEDVAFIHGIGESHVVAWIPIELVFSERTEDNDPEVYTKEWLVQNRELENIPIIAFAPYRNLFLFFMQGLEYPWIYCKWYERLFTSREKKPIYTDEQLIEKRFCEFKVMQRELNKGMQFFIENPAVAKWNQKGYFNLIDGHHRVCFLHYSGISRVPVQITKRDYTLWCNVESAKKVSDSIFAQQKTEFYQPILNPFYLNLHSYREDYTKSRLHYILEVLGRYRFQGKKVIDIGANLGYMGQMFCRMGAEVTMLEPDCLHYSLLKKLNELLYTDCEVEAKRFEEYDAGKKFDIAIMLTVFYHYFSDESVRKKFVQSLDRNISKIVIWESGDRQEEEKTYIMEHTKFHNYTHLCYTYATGKFREMGIFAIDDLEDI